MNTPDVTPVQKLVAAFIVLATATMTAMAAFGVDLTTAQITGLIGVFSAVGGLFVVADAYLRGQRASNATALTKAAAAPPPAQDVTVNIPS